MGSARAPHVPARRAPTAKAVATALLTAREKAAVSPRACFRASSGRRGACTRSGAHHRLMREASITDPTAAVVPRRSICRMIKWAVASSLGLSLTTRLVDATPMGAMASRNARLSAAAPPGYAEANARSVAPTAAMSTDEATAGMNTATASRRAAVTGRSRGVHQFAVRLRSRGASRTVTRGRTPHGCDPAPRVRRPPPRRRWFNPSGRFNFSQPRQRGLCQRHRSCPQRRASRVSGSCGKRVARDHIGAAVRGPHKRANHLA